MPDYLVVPVATLLILGGLGICSAIALWLRQREPIDPDPEEVPAPVLMATITWEQVRPYRYVPAHRIRWDNPGHESRLRVGPWVAATLELPYVEIAPVSDDTLAQVYQGGGSRG